LSRIFIAGIALDALSQKEALAEIDDFLVGRVSQNQKIQSAWGSSRSPQKFLLTTPNPEIILAAQQNLAFKKVLNSAALSTADGIGILWAAHFLNLKKRNCWNLLSSLGAILFNSRKIRNVIPERITGTDLFPKILEIAAAHKKKVFLLGAGEGVAEKLKIKFESEFPGLEISGTFSGSPDLENEITIREKINNSKAEVLFVAFGAPKQELWLARNLPLLKSVKFGAGIGGAFDFHAGKIARAPKIFRQFGLEWFWRLIRQPSRIGRIWNATFRFIGLVWKNRKA
jgi:N-acetylglucosaminyldiphosphoundecaprenol N-acetyl-beta-D-mannosaminyltransferase